MYLINKINLMEMESNVEMGTISARGQVCIPSSMREDLGLEDGSKIIFLKMGDSVLMKKASLETFEAITKPLKEEMRRMGIKDDSVAMVHKMRTGQ
jgi:AbrB family looped-hinge helix DNA binding protein